MKLGLLVPMGALLIATFSGLPAIAQEAPPLPMGTVYLTGDLISETVAGPVNYRTTLATPTASSPQKAYAAMAFVGASYQTRFAYPAPFDFRLEGPMTAKIWVSCEYPVVQGEGGAVSSSRFSLLRGTTALKAHSRTDAAEHCTGPTFIREFNFQVDVTGVSFKKGETVNFEFLFFNVNPGRALLPNFHFLVNSVSRPAAVKAAGLAIDPTAIVATPPETFALSGPGGPVSAGRGGSVEFPIQVTNAAESEANFTVSATDLPEGLAIGFEPQAGSVPAGLQAEVLASLAIAETAPLGAGTFTVNVSGPNGGFAVLPVAYEVREAGSASSMPGSSPLASGSATKASSTGTGAKAQSQEPEGGSTPSPSIVAGLGLLAAAALVLRRRRA